MPPKGKDEEVVRTYLQKLCDGDPQKLAALAGMNQETVPDDLQEPAEMSLANAIIEGPEQLGPGTAHGDNPVPVEAAAVAPVAHLRRLHQMPTQLQRSQDSSEPTQGAKACGTLQVPSYPAAPQTTVFTVAQH